eukprot:scaffold4151_cov162-Amphora_coffeaeformis.AAC.8
MIVAVAMIVVLVKPSDATAIVVAVVVESSFNSLYAIKHGVGELTQWQDIKRFLQLNTDVFNT